MPDEFSVNLTLLCSYHASIAEVCRKLSLNRQQFNKYLSGKSRPSRSNMRRICDFFGVTEAELLLDTDKFEDLISLRRKPIQQEDLSRPLRRLNSLYRKSQSLEKYTGFYFRYFFSFGNQGLVIRSLASIHQEDEKYYWKNIEILRDPETGRTTGVNKYDGACFYLADRIYVIEHETLELGSITQVTLYPSHRHRLDRLVGIQMGAPTRRGRKPGASRVLLEFLGRDINIRAALRKTGLFFPHGGEIRKETLELISNEIAPDAFVLDVDEP